MSNAFVDMLYTAKIEIEAELAEAEAELFRAEEQAAAHAQALEGIKRARHEVTGILARLQGEPVAHALDRRVQGYLANIEAEAPVASSKPHVDNARRKVDDRRQALRQLDMLLGITPGSKSAIVAPPAVVAAEDELEYA